MITPIISETPVQEISWPENENRIFIKRDDLIPYSFGGNKVRIAEAFLADMHARGGDAMIIYGDLRSNLCRVLANRLADLQIPSVMIATEENEEDGYVPFNTSLIHFFGSEVITCPKDGIAEAVDRAFEMLISRGLRPYYIYGDRTGSGNEGTAAAAYAAVWPEITGFEVRHAIHFDRIYVPYGTGSTMGGLIAGEIEHGEPENRVTGISISSRDPARAVNILKTAILSRLKKSGTPLPRDTGAWIDLHTEYNCGGYGRYTGRIEDILRQMLISCGIPMDPTYTAKAFAGMLSDLRKNRAAGKNILFIHTGGLPLFFDYLRSHPELSGH